MHTFWIWQLGKSVTSITNIPGHASGLSVLTFHTDQYTLHDWCDKLSENKFSVDYKANSHNKDGLKS